MKQFFILVSALCSVGVHAQMLCDDLTNIPVYQSIQSNTIQHGDTVSLVNSNVTLVVDTGVWYSPIHFFSSNFHPEISGITGDNNLIITSNAVSDNMYLDGYQIVWHAPGFLYYQFYIDGVPSDTSQEFGHEYSEFPMVVNGVTVSLDTTINLNTLDPGDNHFRMIFEGLGSKVLKLNSSVHFVLNNVCVGNYAVDLGEIEPNLVYTFLDLNNMLNINLKDLPESELYLFNSQGKLVKQMKAIGKAEINMAEEAKGLYILKVISGSSVVTEKILVD